MGYQLLLFSKLQGKVRKTSRRKLMPPYTLSLQLLSQYHKPIRLNWGVLLCEAPSAFIFCKLGKSYSTSSLPLFLWGRLAHPHLHVVCAVSALCLFRVEPLGRVLHDIWRFISCFVFWSVSLFTIFFITVVVSSSSFVVSLFLFLYKILVSDCLFVNWRWAEAISVLYT